MSEYKAPFKLAPDAADLAERLVQVYEAAGHDSTRLKLAIELVASFQKGE